MKQLIIILVLIISIKGFTQSPVEIVGKWINVPKQNTIVEVYKVGDEFMGKIQWAKDNDERKPVGFTIMDHLRFNPKTNSWEHGKIHDPNSGKTYSATAVIRPDDTLELYAYMGIKLLGTSKIFKRVK